MKIYFDNTQIDNNYIMGLSQEGTLFTDTFKLGSTLCKTVNLEVSKDGWAAAQPSNIYIKDDNNNILFNLIIDSVNDTNDAYYSYSLVDKMILLNKNYDWSSLENSTVQNILNAICTNILGTTAPTVSYLSDMVVTWSNDISARDFVSYVAEVNGCYAAIDETNSLVFKTFSNNNRKTVNLNTCADFELGEYHQIDRVVVDLGTATHKYPADGSYSGTHNTLYINPSNILLTDSGSYTIDAIIQHIYGLINGYEFYSIKTSRCGVSDNIKAGDSIVFTDGTNSYPSIAQINWNYNGLWIGGYDLSIESKKQGETQIVSTAQSVKSLKINVDRQLNQITQRVDDVEAEVQELSGNIITNVDVLYGKSDSSSTSPETWTTLAPQWNDNKTMWYKGKSTHVDTSIVESTPLIITKDDNSKVVSSVTELYYCSNNESIDGPQSHITTNTSVYNQWTKKCPDTNSDYTYYFICNEINYTNGSYSWTIPVLVDSYLSNQSINNKVTLLTTNVSSVTQKANGLEVTVQQINETRLPNLESRTSTLETTVSIESDGVHISSGEPGSYTLVSDDGMDIYVGGSKVAYARNDGFYASDYIMNGWHLTNANNNNSFCFIRKEYNN